MGHMARNMQTLSYLSFVLLIFQADNVTGDFSALLLAIFLALGMAFMAASFITFIVQERVSKVIKYAKKLLF